MKSFKPKMSDGLGASKAMSPEAHAEWMDKGGKHSSEIGYDAVGAKVGSSNDSMVKKKDIGPDAAGVKLGGLKQADIRKHEGAVKAKGKEAGMHGGVSSAGKAATGHKSGPMRGAGKGKEGAVKGYPKSNKKGVGGSGR